MISSFAKRIVSTVSMLFAALLMLLSLGARAEYAETLAVMREQNASTVKLKALTSRSQGRNVRVVMHRIKVYMQGWLGYYSIADMKTTIDDWNGWLRRRIRMYIWKQWKKPKTRVKNLLKLGIPEWAAYNYGNSRKGYWRMSGTTTLNNALSNKRLAQAGYFDISQKYKSLHLSG